MGKSDKFILFLNSMLQNSLTWLFKISRLNAKQNTNKSYSGGNNWVLSYFDSRLIFSVCLNIEVLFLIILLNGILIKEIDNLPYLVIQFSLACPISARP